MQCGNPVEKCRDPEHAAEPYGWHPQFEYCYADAALAAANRIYDELHKDKPFHNGAFTRFSEDFSPSTPYHVRDGVRIWISEHDYTPDASFLKSRNPLKPLPKPVNGDDDGRTPGEGDPRP